MWFLYLHMRGEQRPALILTASHKHEHVIAASLQLSEMRVERYGADGGFMTTDLSVGRKVGPVAYAAHIQFVFGDSDGRNMGAVGTDA